MGRQLETSSLTLLFLKRGIVLRINVKFSTDVFFNSSKLYKSKNGIMMKMQAAIPLLLYSSFHILELQIKVPVRNYTANSNTTVIQYVVFLFYTFAWILQNYP